jgi:hypothetical protein
MRWPTVSILLVALIFAGCSQPGERKKEASKEASKETDQQDRNSPAFKAGKVAHEIAKQTGKAAAAAGRQLEDGARKAHEGWKEQAKEDRERERSKKP